MQRLLSQINSNSDTYKTYYKHNVEQVKILEERQTTVRNAGERGNQRMTERGKLQARERLELLLDRNTPFLELSSLAAYDMYNNETAGAGLITGIGIVNGIECVIVVNNPAIKGGTTYPISLTKSLRAQEIAITNRLPMINLVESGGANLPHQAEIFVPGGRGFANQARLSGLGVPQISVVFGNSTAGGAYIPGMSD